MKMPRRAGPSATVCIVALAALLFPLRAWGWGAAGHRIVAVIAADNLTPAAQTHVANILRVPAEKRAIAAAMESAAVLLQTLTPQAVGFACAEAGTCCC